jgi:hypothetical protein
MDYTTKNSKQWLVTFLLFCVWGGLLAIVARDNKSQLVEKYQALVKAPPTSISFDILLHDAPAGIQRGSMYFDTGRGFNPNEVVVFTYSQRSEEAKHFVIKIPTDKRVLRLRFDPLDGVGKLSIKDVSITKYNEKKVSFVQEELNAVKNKSISKVEVDGSTVTITCTGGDPFLVLVNDISPYLQK